jgi:hypothetical protein
VDKRLSPMSRRFVAESAVVLGVSEEQVVAWLVALGVSGWLDREGLSSRTDCETMARSIWRKALRDGLVKPGESRYE